MKVKGILIFLCAIVLSASLKAQEENIAQQSLSAEELNLVKAFNSFAINLYKESQSKKSMVLSPLSVSCAMAMANNGADGKTRQEILDVIGGGADMEAMNGFCKKILEGFGQLDTKTEVKLANTIFFNQMWGLKLKAPFQQKTKDYYNATPEIRDFSDGMTLNVINQWGSNQTDGMIQQILNESEFDPLAVSYLLNALCFKAPWTMPFNPNQTRDEAFDDGRKTVKMMETMGVYNYKETDACQSVALPFGDGAYQMKVLLPKTGRSFDDILSELGDGSSLTSGFKQKTVIVRIPQFTVNIDFDLTGVLKSLGIKNAFEGGEGFNEFCYKDDDETTSSNVFITKVKQSAMIDVNEYGCKASAVTVIETHGSGNDKVMFNANRPFLFLIHEASTGCILFAGQYMGETTTGITETKTSTGNNHASPIYSLSGQRQQTEPLKGLYIKNGKKYVVK